MCVHVRTVFQSSTTEAMKRFPFVGQFLGRLCWNPYVTADGKFMTLLLAGGVFPIWDGEIGLQALGIYSHFPVNPLATCWAFIFPFILFPPSF